MLCSCVAYAEYRRGADFGVRKASEIRAYDLHPQAGMYLLTDESPYGHVGRIESVRDGIIHTSNGSSWGITRCTYWERDITVGDPRIIGVTW